MTKNFEGSFNDSDLERPRWCNKTREIACYDYHHADGKYAFSKLRGENPHGEKVFTTRRRNRVSFSDRFDAETKGDWFSGQGDEPNLLYRLPELIDATRNERALVLITEGEKDAETARTLGFTATTNPNGAMKWEASFSEFFDGCEAVILPDNDERGAKHAEKVAQSVLPFVATVKIVKLPGLKAKGDLTDWVEKTGERALAELSALIDEAPEYQKAVQTSKIANVDNVASILETEPVWAGVMVYDEFADQLVLRKPVPGTKVNKSRFRERHWEDSDDISAVRWFNRHGFPRVSKAVVSDAIRDVAKRSIASPVSDFLNQLEWDGEHRLSHWLELYCKAQVTSSSGEADYAKRQYVSEVGRKWMISAVARALEPGCKVDACLILEGPQGVGKSTLLRILADGGFGSSHRYSWFTDSLQRFDGRDAQSALRGCWIVELPELAAARRSDVETIKAYLSRQEDRYRPAYGRYEVQMPRRCVFAGTTNRNDYLRDETGNRRFWPVTVNRIDFGELEAVRDQLWAEAVFAFREGENWHLTGGAARYQLEVTKERAEEDPWVRVLPHLKDFKEITTSDVLRLLGKDPKEQNKGDAIRVGAMLQRALWIKSGKFTSGSRRGLGRYLNPNTAAALDLSDVQISKIRAKMGEADPM